jgi:hypothetical protein
MTSKSSRRGTRNVAILKLNRTRTICCYRGESALPKWTRITAAIAQAMVPEEVIVTNDDIPHVSPRGLKRIVASTKPVYLRDELLPGQPLTRDLLTRRKPQKPKFKPGDRVVMVRTTQLDYYGTPLALMPGGVLKVERAVPDQDRPGSLRAGLLHGSFPSRAVRHC